MIKQIAHARGDRVVIGACALEGGAGFIFKSRFFNRKSGFFNRKSRFFNRKSRLEGGDAWVFIIFNAKFIILNLKFISFSMKEFTCASHGLRPSPLTPAKSIIIYAKSITFNAKFKILNAKFIICHLNANLKKWVYFTLMPILNQPFSGYGV